MKLFAPVSLVIPYKSFVVVVFTNLKVDNLFFVVVVVFTNLKVDNLFQRSQ